MHQSRLLLTVGLAAALAASPARAQSAPDLLAQATRAYQGLDLEAAAGLLRQVLAAGRPDTLPTVERAGALMYLFATELLRERRDSAAAVARELLRAEPRYQPDELVFPPEIISTFGDIRRRSRIVAARTPPAVSFRPGAENLPITLVATAPHDVVVTLSRGEGAPRRTLFAGPIADTLRLRWDGLDADGAVAAAGSYVVSVSSMGARGRPARQLRLPLEVTVLEEDQADPRSDERPAAGGSSPSRLRLVTGALVGATAALLPRLIAPGEAASGTRFVLGGAIALSGVVGVVARRPRGPGLPTTPLLSAGARNGGDRAAAAMRLVRIAVRAGEPSVVDLERAAP